MANIYCQVCGEKKGIFDKTCKNCGHVFLKLDAESQNAPGMEALWQEAPVMEPSEELHEEGQTELPANLPGGGQGQKALQQPTRQSRRTKKARKAKSKKQPRVQNKKKKVPERVRNVRILSAAIVGMMGVSMLAAGGSILSGNTETPQYVANDPWNVSVAEDDSAQEITVYKNIGEYEQCDDMYLGIRCVEVDEVNLPIYLDDLVEDQENYKLVYFYLETYNDGDRANIYTNSDIQAWADGEQMQTIHIGLHRNGFHCNTAYITPSKQVTDSLIPVVVPKDCKEVQLEIQKRDQSKKVVWTIDLTDIGEGSFVETSVFEGWGK